MHATEQDSNTGISRASRRRFLAGVGAMGLGATGLAACGGEDAASTPSTSAASSVADASVTGPKKKLIWALAAIAPWNLPVDVGFHDATKLLGWDYQKVGIPLDQYSPENVVNVIDRATQAKPDVLVTPAWVPGVAAAAKRAQDEGILVYFNDANNIKPQASELGIPYIGADDFGTGQSIGTTTYEALREKGKTSGKIIGGIAYPGNANLEDSMRGAFAAIAELNKKNGTSFQTERFIDGTAKGNGPGRIQYAAKARQVGKKDLVGVLTIADVSAVTGALQELGYGKGDVVVGTWNMLPTTVTAIEQGWVVGTADKQAYTHGFVTAMLAWQELNRVQIGHDYLNTGGALSVVTQKNIAQIKKRETMIQDLGKKYGVKLT